MGVDESFPFLERDDLPVFCIIIRAYFEYTFVVENN